MPGLRRAPLTVAASALLLALTACSSGTAGASGSTGTASGATSSPSATASGTASSGPSASSTTTAAADQTVEITIRGKQVTPAPHRVELTSGQTLRLVVTSDHNDELHAHGFDVERELVAGQPTTVDLTGAPPGLYEVETHEPELRLLQVVVRP
ncbi:cupredoxin domain-containing protein [Angustibacter sp. Root456]|uniref:cupredoxin domain-containing protein n=1 Tax=Angustibacter sp. Root456 TaxID=1736539 RepID=UPI000B28D256|nr:cupredoxin domain-containing protein [Angustibacter sp. Root456]